MATAARRPPAVSRLLAELRGGRRRPPCGSPGSLALQGVPLAPGRTASGTGYLFDSPAGGTAHRFHIGYVITIYAAGYTPASGPLTNPWAIRCDVGLFANPACVVPDVYVVVSASASCGTCLGAASAEEITWAQQNMPGAMGLYPNNPLHKIQDL